MIKAAGRMGDGRPLLLLGLTGENMTRLMADEPILVEAAELGLPPGAVVLIGGRDETALTAQLAEVMGAVACAPPPEPPAPPRTLAAELSKSYLRLALSLDEVAAAHPTAVIATYPGHLVAVVDDEPVRAIDLVTGRTRPVSVDPATRPATG